jgi:hypothetical protein
VEILRLTKSNFNSKKKIPIDEAEEVLRLTLNLPEIDGIIEQGIIEVYDENATEQLELFKKQILVEFVKLVKAII